MCPLLRCSNASGEDEATRGKRRRESQTLQNLLRLNSQDTMKARIGYMRDERRGS